MRVVQPGPETFLQLGDTPNSYLGAAGEVATVTITENGLEFAPGGGGGGGTVNSVVAGTGIAVDNTDPANPVVSATGGGGLTPLQVFSFVAIRM